MNQEKLTPLESIVEEYRKTHQTHKKNIKFYSIYPYTNENIEGYIDLLNLDNKKLLTVGSSADQSINATLKGCKDQTIIDVCPFVEYYYYLKTTAIKNLSYQEFLSLFNPEEIFKDMSLYQKVTEPLKKESSKSYNFWKTLFEHYSAKEVSDSIFSKEQQEAYKIPKINSYLLDEDSYNKTSDLLHEVKPKFIIGDIEEYDRKDQFDCIYLSNIPDYQDEVTGLNTIKNLSLNLTEIGQIAYYQSFSFHPYCKYPDLKMVHKTFPGTRSFDEGENRKDSLYILKKTYGRKRK